MNRREFLVGTSSAVLGAMLPWGCRKQACPCKQPGKQAAFPYLEVSGEPYQIGHAIGKHFAHQIKEGIKRRQKWFDELKSFMNEDLSQRYQPFLEAGRQHFPEAVEELRGSAEGAGVPFEDLMVLILKSELGAMKNKLKPETPGCSTLALAHQDRLLLAHNEDGHIAYDGLMFLVKISVPGKPSFLRLTYPGVYSGSAPSFSDAGIAITTNFIDGRAVRPGGIPRYFISRAARNARTLDEAVKIVTHPQRAFSFHFFLGSVKEKKILSVETSVDHHQVFEVKDLYVHTNHLILDEMRDTPQNEKYVNSSSMTRYRILTAEAQRLFDHLDDVDGDTLIKLLSMHEGAPYSPCRHPQGEVLGTTLAGSLFDLKKGTWDLYYGNPCKGLKQTKTV
jgi:isopenicillin-N N-acyltransferase-like protein